MNSRITRMAQILKIVHVMYMLYKMYKLLQQMSKRKRRLRSARAINNMGLAFADLRMRNDERFFEATRMTVPKFDTLLNMVKGRLQSITGCEPINAETRLGLTLIYLSQGCSFQLLARMHKIGVSMARKIVYETCEAIWDELQSLYISQLNQLDWKRISRRFDKKTGLPHCLGAVDGKCIHAVCSNRNGREMICESTRKTYTIMLLAACDANYIFTLIDASTVSSRSGEGLFSRNAFEKVLMRENLDIPKAENVPGTNVDLQYYFVGHNTFPLKCNLMRPYPGRNLSEKREHFNERIADTRTFIENAFGILASRWQVLNSDIYATQKNVHKIVLATIALHNYLMFETNSGYFSKDLVDHYEDGVFVPGTWRQSNVFLKSCVIAQANRSTVMAFEERETLADLLVNIHS